MRKILGGNRALTLYFETCKILWGLSTLVRNQGKMQMANERKWLILTCRFITGLHVTKRMWSWYKSFFIILSWLNLLIFIADLVNKCWCFNFFRAIWSYQNAFPWCRNFLQSWPILNFSGESLVRFAACSTS